MWYGVQEYKERNKSKNAPEGPYCVHPKAELHSVNFYSLRKYYERDSAYLGLIEAFIQDGPQLVLQLYILAVRHHDDLSDPYTGKQLVSITKTSFTEKRISQLFSRESQFCCL